MKVAVVYNRESRNVINLFGTPNRETIGLKTIKRITDALKKGGHQVTAIEGDKDLVDRLEDFMPRVIKHERPGMVFNVSYGIQGQARYTHIPSILEMVGVPYVASGPLAHSLALDKVVTKMILRQHGLPTPDFAVLNTPDDDLPELRFPLIVKPKNEAVSFGLRIVNDEDELREGARVIYDEYQQPILVEQFIAGREVNIGLLGNSPPEALPPVLLDFGPDGPQIYTYEDKTRASGREIKGVCPAPIGKELIEKAKELAISAFQALGCYDCARVDTRLDDDGNFYILEINSLPSLGEHGSYLVGAANVGLDFADVINRLVESASSRYFGTPEPPSTESLHGEVGTSVFNFITQRRDSIEKRLRDWTNVSSRTNDPVGIGEAVKRMDESLRSLRMNSVQEFTDERSTWLWETGAGFRGGTLMIGHLDVPAEAGTPAQSFRREPEWLHGDGIGTSRAPLVMMEFALRALRSLKALKKLPIGVLFYTDESRDARYSQELIRQAASEAKKVLVLRPGIMGDSVVVNRRGQRKYRLVVEGHSLQPGKATKRPEALRWMCSKLEEFAKIRSQKERYSVSTLDIKTEMLPMLLPHRVQATILATYADGATAGEIDRKMRDILGKSQLKWDLTQVADRPPMKDRRGNLRLASVFGGIAKHWELPLRRESSVWPSVAGLVPAKTACLCGIGPIARELGTPNEAVQRISLIQRTLLLAEFLVKDLEN